ncbi:RNA-splicing ligase RtcB [Deinococcus irradiatisoli]|uniref:3'-phosphate/5'-hydroxy nucleic acid ligase n=1 Tax=Deinococcus irradiatisoli TaxID=2202254 RepID=A0A2Z3JAI5_9DEIO|nr:RtcB family protein [Deinococcus irradiatisoli]AWN22005.1 RNA-splicing ligase RtcB [Deinococcus irradiatisoli]
MNGKHISKLGLNPKAAALALNVARRQEDLGTSRRDILDALSQVKADPEAYLESDYAELARELLAQTCSQVQRQAGSALRPAPLPYAEFGSALIEPGARSQMDVAMRLPVARAGALMPDAHVGYGLPIGGVLAAENAVIPYGVGVDIGCSMQLSVFGTRPEQLPTAEALSLLRRHTRFGAGVGFERRERLDHPVLDDPAWSEQPLLRHLHDKAAEQIGTSGSGNHFVEFGTFTLQAPEEGLETGTYLALLSHSGSRGFGAQVAGHFTKLAEQRHAALDPAARKLAWLPLDSDEGAAYWQAMTLAGHYALANHQQIHARISRALNEAPLLSVRNSHNLAWKEPLEDSELIVHRKGATPAAAGQLGLIPGSMADPAYLVRGRGYAPALASASHGAGRQLGRNAARAALSKTEVADYLAQRGVTLLGGGIDEAPQAYKRIEDVMAAQSDLVDVLGEFMPKVVRMDSGGQDI